MSELTPLLGDRTVGVLRRDRNGRVSFVYDGAWQRSPGAYPLSLSMPLTAAKPGHATVDAFVWGLLPDNERVLDRWAKQFHVSVRNAFALLEHVGEDCACHRTALPPPATARPSRATALLPRTTARLSRATAPPPRTTARPSRGTSSFTTFTSA